MNNGLKYGVMYGVISSIITALGYFVFKDPLTNVIFVPVVIILAFVLMWMAAKAERESQDGLISFGEALVPAFVTIAVGTFISQFVDFTLLKTVPNLLESQAELVGEATVKMMEWVKDYFPDSVQEIDITKAKTESIEQVLSLNLKSVIVGWLFNLIIVFIPALIIAAIVKRNPST